MWLWNPFKAINRPHYFLWGSACCMFILSVFSFLCVFSGLSVLCDDNSSFSWHAQCSCFIFHHVQMNVTSCLQMFSLVDMSSFDFADETLAKRYFYVDNHPGKLGQVWPVSLPFIEIPEANRLPSIPPSSPVSTLPTYLKIIQPTPSLLYQIDFWESFQAFPSCPVPSVKLKLLWWADFLHPLLDLFACLDYLLQVLCFINHSNLLIVLHSTSTQPDLRNNIVQKEEHQLFSKLNKIMIKDKARLLKRQLKKTLISDQSVHRFIPSM